MVPQWGYKAAVSTLLLWLFLNSGVCVGQEIKGSMYSSSLCEKKGSKVFWLSEKKYALITGRSGEDSRKQCEIIFGLASKNADARLKISVDFMFFHDCDVHLQINQSTTKKFSANTNKEMFMSGCYDSFPGTLYAQPKNYVLISLSKKDNKLEGYNFRLNISVTDSSQTASASDKLPTSGPQMYEIVIVSFVCTVLVISAAVLLLKYVIRLSYRWSEERREQAMTRAINLYNSSEPLEEPEMAYIHPGGSGSSSSGSGVQRANRLKQHGPEIAFVHSDGRIERFRPLEQRTEEPVVAGHVTRPKPQKCRVKTGEAPNHQQPRAKPGNTTNTGEEPVRFPVRYPPHAPTLKESRTLPDQAETVSLGGIDMPPSYEEALDMPPPELEEGNVQDESLTEDAEGLIGAVGGVDYGRDGSDSRQQMKANNTDTGKKENSQKDSQDLAELEAHSAPYMNIDGHLEIIDQDTEDEGNEHKESTSAQPLLQPTSPK